MGGGSDKKPPKFDWNTTKKEAIEKGKNTAKYKKIAAKLSPEQKKELDKEIEKKVDDNKSAALKLYLKHPFAGHFVLTMLLGVIGLAISTYWQVKYKTGFYKLGMDLGK